MFHVPHFLYKGNFINLGTRLRAPRYSINGGLKVHTYPGEKLSYTTTSRDYGTTNQRYEIVGIGVDDRDAIYDFWVNTISEGFYDFTVFDTRGRFLFESSWNDWNHLWRKKNGGQYKIDVDIESSVPWTLPTYGAFLMAGETLSDHGRRDVVVEVDGALVNYAEDSNTLRKNGSALKLIGNGNASSLTGASVDVDWTSEYNGSTSIFCQFRTNGASATFEPVDVVRLTKGSNNFGLRIDETIFYGFINDSPVTRSSGSDFTYEYETWYDVAITFDAYSTITYIYFVPSATTEFTNFLDGTSAITEGIGEYTESPAPIIPTNSWSNISFFQEDAAGGIGDADSVFLQNVFVMDGHLTPMAFNLLRRLCYMWNNKTTRYPT